MRAEELRRMTDDELRSEVVARKQEQMNLRFRRARGEGEGLDALRQARRDAARALTVISERRRAAKGAAPEGEAAESEAKERDNA